MTLQTDFFFFFTNRDGGQVVIRRWWQRGRHYVLWSPPGLEHHGSSAPGWSSSYLRSFCFFSSTSSCDWAPGYLSPSCPQHRWPGPPSDSQGGSFAWTPSASSALAPGLSAAFSPLCSSSDPSSFRSWRRHLWSCLRSSPLGSSGLAPSESCREQADGPRSECRRRGPWPSTPDEVLRGAHFVALDRDTNWAGWAGFGSTPGRSAVAAAACNSATQQINEWMRCFNKPMYWLQFSDSTHLKLPGSSLALVGACQVRRSTRESAPGLSGSSFLVTSFIICR